MTRTHRTTSNSSRRYSPTSAMTMFELKSIRGRQNSGDSGGVSVPLPLSNSGQQLCSVPIPFALLPAPATNAIANTSPNTSTTHLHPPIRTHSNTQTITSTPLSLPHPYNLSSSPSTSLSLTNRFLPLPLLKTTTRRLLTTIGLSLSLIMTWWTYASLQAAREANRLAELANLLAFRAECRGLVSDGTGELEPGCEEALAREIVVRRDEYEYSGEEDIRRSVIRKQRDNEVTYGGMEEKREIDIDDKIELWFAKRDAAGLSRFDAEALLALNRELELNGNNLGYSCGQASEMVYGDSGRQRVRLWTGLGQGLWNMFWGGRRYYALRGTSRLSGLIAYNDARLVWDSSLGEGWDGVPTYEWVDRPVWSGYGSGGSRSLSGISMMNGGMGVDMWTGLEMIVCHIMWLLPIWIVFRAAWRSLREKLRLGREKKQKNGKKKEEKMKRE